MLEEKCVVRLKNGERSPCEDTVKRLGGPTQKGRRARSLLLADPDGPEASIDHVIAKTCRCHTATVENLRCRSLLECARRALDSRCRASLPIPKTRFRATL